MKNRVKEVFISRFPDGWIYEIDFSQLEILALAYLTQDPQLVEDIIEGRDMHTIRARELYEVKEPTKTQRTHAKVLSFQLQYGSGAKKMAESWNLPLKLCKKFIENYYKRYPKVLEWQEDKIKEINSSPSVESFKGKIVNGQQQRAVMATSKTGRRYMFIQQEAPDFLKKKGTEWGFKPTEIKNYFVQGFATGDFVPLFAGELHLRVYRDNLNVLFINTVHDSILVDVPDEETERFENLVHECLDDTYNLIRKWLADDWDLPIKATIERGHRWSDKKEIEHGNNQR